jgi:hypothetical protein
MTQTRDGYLWLATADGLARFDGARFQVFSRSNSPGIANNRFISLFEDAQGDLWAGTEENGVTRIHAGRFESFAAVEGVTLGMVSRITGDAGGNAILGRVGPETFRFADGKFSNLQDGGSSETASEWRRGRSFKLLCRNAAEDQKIARCFVDGKLTEYSLHDTASVPDFLKVVQDDNGTVWLISSPDKRLFWV